MNTENATTAYKNSPTLNETPKRPMLGSALDHIAHGLIFSPTENDGRSTQGFSDSSPQQSSSDPASSPEIGQPLTSDDELVVVDDDVQNEASSIPR